jgi:flavin-dependent dehydrogenase
MNLVHPEPPAEPTRMDLLACTRFDAVVIGAGPAGSSAAIWLARAGWRVALVEKQRFPRLKVCGECLAASNLPLLQALGVGAAFHRAGGPELRQVALLCGTRSVHAALPPARHEAGAWGRALGRDTLDSLLLQQARAAGVRVLQPWSVQVLRGQPGAWHCDLRATDSRDDEPAHPLQQTLHTPVVVDAHGSWEFLTNPTPAETPRRTRQDSDLLAFKATFTGANVSSGSIGVLALSGGYGGLVLADAGTSTLACCIRLDRLRTLRQAVPGLNAGEVVQAWLQRECPPVAAALEGATRTSPWLACGPLAPGVRLSGRDPVFRIGNAAGEAHPILGEGMSMALQSAALLCAQLLPHSGQLLTRNKGHTPHTAALLADCQRRYTSAWRRNLGPRLQLAAAFAHTAMRPGATQLLMGLLQAWPGLLTQGARWGAKVRPAVPPQRLVGPSIF